jgi:hypothetical protein
MLLPGDHLGARRQVGAIHRGAAAAPRMALRCFLGAPSVVVLAPSFPWMLDADFSPAATATAAAP